MEKHRDDLWNELKSTLYKKLALAYGFNHILSGFAKFALRVDKIPSN
jgi:hypothetical protein